MALTLYGSPRSRTMRSLWVLAELELDYTLVTLEWNDPALKMPAFLALNPAGAIPTAPVRAEFGVAVKAEVANSLATLALSLAVRPWLAADYFTIADLNVASVLSPSRAKHLPLAEYPTISDWLNRCYGRPGALAARRKEN